MAKDAGWLIKKLRGIKWFTVLMILVGFPVFMFITNQGWVEPDYMLVYYFFYIMAWLFIHSILQLVLKPGIKKDYRRFYVASHPELDEATKEAILKGKVIEGMNAEMASASTGTAYRDLPSDDGVPRITTQEKFVKGSQV